MPRSMYVRSDELLAHLRKRGHLTPEVEAALIAKGAALVLVEDGGPDLPAPSMVRNAARKTQRSRTFRKRRR